MSLYDIPWVDLDDIGEPEPVNPEREVVCSECRLVVPKEVGCSECD